MMKAGRSWNPHLKPDRQRHDNLPAVLAVFEAMLCCDQWLSNLLDRTTPRQIHNCCPERHKGINVYVCRGHTTVTRQIMEVSQVS